MGCNISSMGKVMESKGGKWVINGKEVEVSKAVYTLPESSNPPSSQPKEPIKPESEWLECEMCKEVNETVQWVTDPYELEVHDIHTSICVCNTCENDRAGEV